jgi:hypothetical protein
MTLSGQNCSDDPVYLWTNSEYVGQTTTGTALTFITGLDLSLVYNDALIPPNTETYDVIINGTTVGSFSIVGANDFGDKPVTNSYSFAPIAGPDYTVLFVLSSASVPGGGGSIGWYQGALQSSFTISDDEVSGVPEPGTFSLMLAPALAGLWALRRSKQ